MEIQCHQLKENLRKKPDQFPIIDRPSLHIERFSHLSEPELRLMTLVEVGVRDKILIWIT